MVTLAEQVRRHFLWLLLLVYGVAALLPGPGDSLAVASLPVGDWLGSTARFPMLLVAVLLLLAAMSTDVASLRVLTRRPWLLGASLVGVWLGPAVAVGSASLLAPRLVAGESSGLLLGLALVAAMPVANSSVGWTQQAGGNLAWALGLVVASILLCPLVTPPLLRLLGLGLSGAQAEQVDQLVNQLAGPTFILWVLAPTTLGFALRGVVGRARIEAARAPVKLINAATIFLLNYLNGSRVAAAFYESPPAVGLVVAATLAAVTIALVGMLSGRLLSDALRLDGPTRSALEFCLSMKNTGLALGLAVSLLDDQPVIGLLIALVTPVQHLVATSIDQEARRAASGSVPKEEEP